MDKYDVAIVGAGPAGMMAAITASGIGKRVALIEKNPRLGRKLLVTGNGRCNLTNKYAAVDRYHGASPEFIKTVLSRFDQHTTMVFFRELGLILKEEDSGRIFPRTNQASSVVEVLRHKLRENQVDVLLDAQVKAIEKPDTWRVVLVDARTLESERLILATGGRAAHHLGSTGDGLYWAEKMGHSLTPIHAALVPIETIETWPSEVQGTKVEAGVWATSDGRKIGESTGDVLFTSYGVSGPAVMALAGSIAPLLETSQVLIHIDLFPDMPTEQLSDLALGIFRTGDTKTVRDALVGVLPDSLIPVVLRIAGLSDGDQAAGIPKNKRLEIVRTLKDLTLTVSHLRRLREAQVTAGGINTDEIDPRTLESKLVKDLYFAGEIIDVHGDSGGFNLQWAWSSGHVAGRM